MIDSLRKLFGLLQPRERRHFFVVLFIMVVLAFLEMARVGSVLPLISAVANPNVIEQNVYFSAVNEYLGEPGFDTLFILLAGLLLFVTLARNAWNALTDYSIARYSHMRSYTISSRLLERYLRQPYAYFLSRNTSTLGRNVLGEVEQATSFLKDTLTFLSQALKGVGLILLIIVADPMLAGMAAVVLVLLYGSTYAVVRGRLNRQGQRRLRANKERFKTASETLEGIKTVRAHNSEPYFLRRFSSAAQKYAKSRAIAELLSTVPKYILDSIVYGGIIAVVVFFVVYVGSIENYIAKLGLFVVAATRLMPALKQTLSAYSKMRAKYPAVDVIYNDLRTGAVHTPDSPSAAPVLTPGKGAERERIHLERHLVLENISFQYEGAEAPLFSGLNLRIEANTTVGLVGTTGCGKTTVMDVILGLLLPGSGRVIADDTVITAENVAAWRRNIGYVPQDIYLIDDTITRNVAFGIPEEEIDRKAVEHAARVAQMAGFIREELPDGYETLVGERGVRLSGGQRQRLGIARALYHNPSVLVFDEATSALDSRTEREVMNFIDDLAHRKTIIMIAHRLSTVERCDDIYVMDKGRIVDQGTYEELLARNEHFKSLAQITP